MRMHDPYAGVAALVFLPIAAIFISLFLHLEPSLILAFLSITTTYTCGWYAHTAFYGSE